tara:strand:+ start:837 stop:1877 length:1041 start_codon:yes stop_codon:yes gene_type:complete
MTLGVSNTYADHSYKTSIVKKVLPSVVEVHSERNMNPDKQLRTPDKSGFQFRNPQQRPEPRGQRRENPKEDPTHLGSGFIISSDGYVITNAHVINNCFNNCAKITIIFQDDVAYEATLINYDEESDIALLKIINPLSIEFPYLIWGAKPELGEDTIAIGSPMSQSFTVTFGNVSSLDRFVPKAASFVPFIQTDAAINPGNSGGPLFNTRGELIGINTMIITGSGGVGSIGIGFAIDGTYAQAVIEQLKTGEKIVRPYLGIMYRPLNKDDVDNFKNGYGAYIQEVVRDSPAFGILKEGDIVLTLDGKSIKWRMLATIVKTKRLGDIIKLEILRDEMIVPIEMTLGAK